ncbi:MAG: MFS transporter [Thermoactinomyces vulgaris]
MSAKQNTADGGGFRQHLPLMIVIMLGMFLAVLNQTLLNVAIPSLINEFNVTASTAQWLLTGYMLVNGILIPFSAYLVDRYGIRRLFIASMVFFTAGSLMCGLAAHVFHDVDRSFDSGGRCRNPDAAGDGGDPSHFPAGGAREKGWGCLGSG